MLSSSVAVKSCWPAPGARMPTRSPRVLAATLRDRAQRHPRLQRAGTSGGPSARLEASSYDSSSLRSRARAEALRELLHQKPRKFGEQSSLWTDLGDGRRSELRGGAHEGAGKRGDHSGYLRAPGGALGAGQTVDHQPRSRVCEKKRRRDRLIRLAQENPESWVVGFEDETWWSRLQRPSLNSWAQAGNPLRLVEQSLEKNDPDPKAISCYGLYLPEFERVWLRFVDGRPVSSITTRFLEWCSERLAEAGKKVWLLIWDNASWHISKEVGEWITSHNCKVKKGGSEAGVRIISRLLPKKSPWLNPMEPRWVHGKRRAMEPDGLLSAHELAERVCSAFDCPHYEHLSIPENVA